MSKPYWKTKDGTNVYISDMAPSHILNVIKHLNSRINHLESEQKDFITLSNSSVNHIIGSKDMFMYTVDKVTQRYADEIKKIENKIEEMRNEFKTR